MKRVSSHVNLISLSLSFSLALPRPRTDAHFHTHKLTESISIFNVILVSFFCLSGQYGPKMEGRCSAQVAQPCIRATLSRVLRGTCNVPILVTCVLLHALGAYIVEGAFACYAGGRRIVISNKEIPKVKSTLSHASKRCAPAHCMHVLHTSTKHIATSWRLVRVTRPARACRTRCLALSLSWLGRPLALSLSLMCSVWAFLGTVVRVGYTHARDPTRRVSSSSALLRSVRFVGGQSHLVSGLQRSLQSPARAVRTGQSRCVRNSQCFLFRSFFLYVLIGMHWT